MTSKRYNSEDLKEFEQLILKKLAIAREELSEFKDVILGNSSNGTDDTSFASHNMQEGGATMVREQTMQLATRQERFIEQLGFALSRIRNGNYGVCRVTGELIPKERLRSVPHATTCINAKQ